MKNLTWQNPEQLFVAQELINKVKSKCCGIKGDMKKNQYNPAITATNAAVMKLLESSNERITDATMNTRQPCFENPNAVSYTHLTLDALAVSRSWNDFLGILKSQGIGTVSYTHLYVQENIYPCFINCANSEIVTSFSSKDILLYYI